MRFGGVFGSLDLLNTLCYAPAIIIAYIINFIKRNYLIANTYIFTNFSDFYNCFLKYFSAIVKEWSA